MNDKKLLELNHIGLIPGPGEEGQEFLQRAEYCLKLHVHWPNISLKDETVITIGEARVISLEKTKKIFDIKPGWIPLFFSNHQLMPWHGGAAWIFQNDDDSPTSAFFQLRKKFLYKKKYLGIYDRDELVAHEVSHVGRMMFEEPEYEELIAYRTSDSKFRRFFGPIVQSSGESLIFVSLLFLILILDFFFLDVEYLQFLKLIPVALIAYGCFRLWKRQRTFSRALSNLESICRDKSKAEAVIYRLTDHEIESFAKSSPEQIEEYVHEQRLKSLRWHLIALAYT